MESLGFGVWLAISWGYIAVALLVGSYLSSHKRWDLDEAVAGALVWPALLMALFAFGSRKLWRRARGSKPEVPKAKVHR